jgi:hypothetical protein
LFDNPGDAQGEKQRATLIAAKSDSRPYAGFTDRGFWQ